MPRPLRSSCDRCHSQKLKCPKLVGVATCTRCRKAGTPCVFSPAGLSTRRSMQPPIPSSYMDSDLVAMQLEWPPLDLESALVTPPELAQEPPSDVTQQVEPAEEIEATSEDLRSFCVRQLTDLAVEVDRACLNLSSLSQIHIPKSRPIGDFHDKFIENVGRNRCVEQLFALAQRLIDVYPQVLKILFDKPGLSDCQDLNCFHTVQLPGELAVIFSPSDGIQNDVDPFLFNLLVSCHSKVIDVMSAIISCAKTCTQVTVASPDFSEPGVHIPELRIGNFVASNSAASTMQVVLLIHLSSVLVEHTRRLSKRVATLVEHEKDSRQAQILKLQCELLEEKTTTRVKLLEQVKEVFTKVGFSELGGTALQ
ncbi:hypothetical protein F5Y04DRAFT_173811 [Hypomontagnella monticulosa]|nr:hypothetical protein F5Y04DRAFT_173811 [Hypomontagnella monticulosa]